MAFKLGSIAVASLALAAPLGAQEPAANGVSAEEQANMNRAALILSTFADILKDPEVDGAEKNALVGCLYENTLDTLSKVTGETLAENPQIDSSDAVNVYLVAAIICGAREPGVAPAAAE